MTLRWDSTSFCPLHFRGMDVLYVSFLAMPLPAYAVVAVELVLIAVFATGSLAQVGGSRHCKSLEEERWCLLPCSSSATCDDELSQECEIVYGSSESNPRARALATAWTRVCTPSFE